MKLAIVTDSTCDLRQAKLEEIQVYRTPLYVQFNDKNHKDWIEITPSEIIAGVQAGADMPKTSQPTPTDFQSTYHQAISEGAEQILCITIGSDLSGTHKSAVMAADMVDVPVTIFDSRYVSMGIAAMVIRANDMRANGSSLEEIVSELERIRDNGKLCFTVANLDFLQKGGRVGRASALVGGLLNIKPILAIKDSAVEPIGRARGAKKALKMMVAEIESYVEEAKSTFADKQVVIRYVYVGDESALEGLRQAVSDSDLNIDDRGSYEMGAVVASHGGPGTYGFFLHSE